MFFFLYLGLVACARHPALEEGEGANDLVLLRLRLGRDAVLIQLLLFDPEGGEEQTMKNLLLFPLPRPARRAMLVKSRQPGFLFPLLLSRVHKRNIHADKCLFSCKSVL